MFQPTLQRFSSRDPLSPDGVEVMTDTGYFGERLAAMRANPSYYGGNWEHPYVYAYNNPVNAIDPSGLQPPFNSGPGSGMGGPASPPPIVRYPGTLPPLSNTGNISGMGGPVRPQYVPANPPPLGPGGIDYPPARGMIIPSPATAPVPQAPIRITIPVPEKGCEGWCMSLHGARVTSVHIDSFAFIRRRGGCPLAFRFATNDKIQAEIEDLINQGVDLNSCSTGCFCRDRRLLDGQTITVTFAGEVIELDPAEFDWPANLFVKGDCLLQLWGSGVIRVGRGWVGVCRK